MVANESLLHNLIAFITSLHIYLREYKFIRSKALIFLKVVFRLEPNVVHLPNHIQPFIRYAELYSFSKQSASYFQKFKKCFKSFKFFQIGLAP